MEPAEKDDRGPECQNEGGGAEVRLAEDEEGGEEDEEGRDDEEPRLGARLAVAQAVEPARKNEDEADPHDLGGLNAEGAEAQPARGVARGRPGELHPQEKEHPGGPSGPSKAAPVAQIHAGNGESKGEASGHAVELRAHPRLGRAAGGGIEREQAEGADAEDGQEEEPVRPPTAHQGRRAARGGGGARASSPGAGKKRGARPRTGKKALIPAPLTRRDSPSGRCAGRRGGGSRTMGAATAEPPPPCSTTAAAAKRGRASGA